MMTFRLILALLICAFAAGVEDKPKASNEECRLALRVLAYEDEIAAGERPFPDAGLSTFRYNLYDPADLDAQKPVGIYIGASHTINNHDCIGTGAFNFDYKSETDSYDSQIFVSVSCSGSFNAITGGTGRYAFIKNGHEVITEAKDVDRGSISELQFTSETCGTENASMTKRI